MPTGLDGDRAPVESPITCPENVVEIILSVLEMLDDDQSFFTI